MLACSLAACGEETKADGSFEVLESKGARKTPLPEPAEKQGGGNPHGEAAGFHGTGGGFHGTEAPAGSGGMGSSSVDLRWTIPDSFQEERAPGSLAGIYRDFFRIERTGDETHDTLLTTFVGPGTVAANIGRWKSQFAGGEVVGERTMKIPGREEGEAIEAAVLEMEGPSYAPAAQLWQTGMPSRVRAIFVAAPLPNGQLLTIRLLGPPGGVQRVEKDFWTFTESLRTAGS